MHRLILECRVVATAIAYFRRIYTRYDFSCAFSFVHGTFSFEHGSKFTLAYCIILLESGHGK